MKINAKKENKLVAAWISFSWPGWIFLQMITAAFFLNPMLKITFMFKRFMYDLYLDPGATWSAKNNKKMKTEKKTMTFGMTDIQSYSTAGISL